MDLCDLSWRELQPMLARREVSCLELLGSIERRTIEKEPGVRGYVTPLFDDARRVAETLDRHPVEGGRLPLIGLPLAVKDNICLKGVRATCGSHILDSFVAPYDATAVARLKQAGAIIIGKTNLDEFAMGSSNETSYFGPVHNPHDTARVPGGSSGGSCAVVAYGGAVAALGSDTGGSVRQPAAFCGVVGLRPTYGRVSRYGLVAFASSLDIIGPVGRCVADVESVFSVMAGLDPRDSTSFDPSATPPIPERLHIGVPKEYFPTDLDPQIAHAVRLALDKLSQAGHVIEDTSLPMTDYAVAAYQILVMAEAASNLARYDSVRYGLRATAEDLRTQYRMTRDAGFGSEVKRRIILGAYALSRGYYDEYYLTAQKVRTRFVEEFRAAFLKFDLLVTPTTPTLPFELGEKTRDPVAMYLSDVFTAPSALAGLPALSLPLARAQGQLPIGIHLVGPACREDLVFALGSQLERI